MNWVRIGYAFACVIVPVAWGLVVVWVSNRFDVRSRRGDRGEGGCDTSRSRPIEYHI